MSSPSFPFSSPLGPLHLASAASSSSFIADLARLAFFTRSSKPKSSNKPKYSHQNTSTAPLGLSVREEKSAAAQSTYYPRDSIPPSYQEAVGLEEDLEFEDGSSGATGSAPSNGSDARTQRKQAQRERLLRQDRDMGAGLASMGL
mgnify:CR=1 FL=1